MRVATPPLRLFVPKSTPSARKLTDPVGVPETEVTVAINVMICPTADGFGDDANDVDVLARTFSVKIDEVLAA